MDFSGIAWALFLPACFALNAAPGPNNLTAFVNGARRPFWAAMLGCAGRLPAFALLIGLTAIGLGAALAASSAALWIIKLLGAAYLIYIGLRFLRAPPPTPNAPDGAAASARDDFMVALTNPKAIAIFTAFFPQFLDPERAIAPQILAMGAAFLALELLAAALYVLAGRGLRGAVRRAGGFSLLQKGVGALLIGSGLSMAASAR